MPTSPGTPGPSDVGVPAPPADEPRLGLVGLLRTGGFRRLLAVRFSTQWGDGMFQAALGGAVLFNPEREADPLAVAAGLAVLLLPYSVVGPFAGALLDRWDRRRVLLVAGLLRAVLVLAVAVTVYAGIAGVPLYLGALAVAGVSRFVLAGLSAALPHVVPRRHLVEANVVAATAGAGFAALGGVSAIGLRALVGAGDTGSAVVTAVAAAGSLVAAGVAAGFARRALGPDARPAEQAAGGDARPCDQAVRVDEPDRTVVAVARGLADGARAAAATPTVAASFAALAAHRLAFGVTTLLSLLMFRYAFSSADAGALPTGLAGVGAAVGIAAAGLGMAALLTPWLVRRLGRARTVRLALLVAAATQLGLAGLLALPAENLLAGSSIGALLVAAFLIAGAGQVVKLCADAAVQREIGDDVRGRVFALYDAVFNVCYVLAVAAAALLGPSDGRAPWLLGAAAGLYLLGLLAHDRALRVRGGRAGQGGPPAGRAR